MLAFDITRFTVSLGLAFLVGIVASLHCSLMCGALYASFGRDNKYKKPIFFQFGRLFSYLFLSALFFKFGEFLIRPYIKELGTLSFLVVLVLLIGGAFYYFSKDVSQTLNKKIRFTKNYVTNLLLKNRDTSYSVY